ncbi:MAG: sodium pump decarboxylase subunit gamma [Ruminiclostridium sp.]|nr:sodium pump decarboxylase subunit gamma [Ruminiclostridium sp.]
MNNNNLSGEILAVIAATVASQNTRPGQKLEVKAIRRISQVSPIWNTTGRIERLSRNLNTL